jgi:hypothetical protein
VAWNDTNGLRLSMVLETPIRSHATLGRASAAAAALLRAAAGRRDE